MEPNIDPRVLFVNVSSCIAMSTKSELEKGLCDHIQIGSIAVKARTTRGPSCSRAWRSLNPPVQFACFMCVLQFEVRTTCALQDCVSSGIAGTAHPFRKPVAVATYAEGIPLLSRLGFKTCMRVKFYEDAVKAKARKGSQIGSDAKSDLGDAPASAREQEKCVTIRVYFDLILGRGWEGLAGGAFFRIPYITLWANSVP